MTNGGNLTAGDGRGPIRFPTPPDASMREAWLRIRLETSPRPFRQHADDVLAWATGADAKSRAMRASLVAHLHDVLDELGRVRDSAQTLERERVQQVAELRGEFERAEAARQALLKGLDHVEREIDRIELDEANSGLLGPAGRNSRLRAATTRAHNLHREAWER